MDNWHPWEADALLYQKLMHPWEERVNRVVAWSFLFLKHFPHTGDPCAIVSISIHKASHIWTQPSFKSLSCVLLFENIWAVGCQAPVSMGILQARILEWVAISFSRGSSRPRDWTQVSRLAGRRFNLWATREAGIPTILVCLGKMLSVIIRVTILKSCHSTNQVFCKNASFSRKFIERTFG